MRYTLALFAAPFALAGFLLAPVSAGAASTAITLGSLTPAQDTTGYLTTAIYVTTTDPITAVTADLRATNLTYEDISYENSLFPIELSPVSSGSDEVTVSRIRTDTGFTGSNGLVATVYWLPTNSGPASVTVNQSTSIAASYSDGGNILSSVAGTTSTVTAAPSPVPPSGAKPSGQPVTHADTTLDEAGMQLPTTGTASASPVDYARYIFLGLGIVLIILAVLGWRKLHSTASRL